MSQLHSLLVGPQATVEKTSEVLEYFFEKLTGSNLTPRRLALKVSAFSYIAHVHVAAVGKCKCVS